MPLTPAEIPPQEYPGEADNRPHRTADNPLEFRPAGGLLFFMRLPFIIISGILVGYLLGRFHYSILLLLPVGHVVYYVLRRRARAFARTVESLSKAKVRRDSVGEFETVEWMNYIVRKFWEVSEAGISSQIYSIVNMELRKNKPAFLKSLRLTELTLGTRPPIIERIGFMDKSDEVITLECIFNFIPTETSEDVLFYFGEEREHWNTCIELTAQVGFVSIPLLVRNFTFSGIIRMEIALTRRIPFLSKASISMVELPIVDFDILPLRAADIMDLGYLAGFIHRLINSKITQLMLYPKKIEVDLQHVADYRGTSIGVVYVYVHLLESTEQEPVYVILSNDGREFGTTSQQAGRDPLFNEGFYTLVMDTTRNINVTLHTRDEHLSGRISLRNLNRHTYAESLHLSSERSRRFLNISTSFYPITAERTGSAIISLSLVSVRDLQALGQPKNRLYSTYVLITLETKDSIRVRRVLQTFESKRIFSSKDPFYNEDFHFFVRNFSDFIVKLEVMDDKKETPIGSLILPLENVEESGPGMFRLSGVENGEVELKFGLSFIDMWANADSKASADNNAIADSNADVDATPDSAPHSDLPPCEDPASNASQFGVGEFVHPVQDDSNKVSKSLDSSNDRPPQILFPNNSTLGIYNSAKPSNGFVHFKEVHKLTVKSISDKGAFYLVFETPYILQKAGPFCTDMPILACAALPLVNDEPVRTRLYRMLISGDVLVGETLYEPGQSVLVFDWLRVELTVAVGELSDSKPTSEKECCIVQCVVDRPIVEDPVRHRGSLFAAEVYSGGIMVGQSVAGTLFRFCSSGKKLLRGALRENDRCLVSFGFDAGTYEQQISAAPGLETKLRVKTQACGFSLPVAPLRGMLEIFVIKASAVRGMRGGSSDPYVKVFHNNDKIFKTSVKSRELDPIFHESCRVAVEKNKDTLEFYINDYSAISQSKMICFKELPLFNLSAGYSRFELEMNDGEDGGACETKLQLILNYTELPAGM